MIIPVEEDGTPAAWATLHRRRVCLGLADELKIRSVCAELQQPLISSFSGRVEEEETRELTERRAGTICMEGGVKHLQEKREAGCLIWEGSFSYVQGK